MIFVPVVCCVLAPVAITSHLVCALGKSWTEHQLTLRLAEEEITMAGLAEETKRQLGETLWKTSQYAKFL